VSGPGVDVDLSPTALDAGSTGSVRTRVLGNVLKLLQAGPILILVVLCLIMWRLEPVFLTSVNIQNVLVQSSVVAILAVGSLVVILTGGIDLSVGSALALATVVGALAFRTESFRGSAAVIATMVLVGLVVGLINGLVYVKGRVPHPFIVTLAMLAVAQGLGLVLAKGQLLSGMPPLVGTLGNGFVGAVPVPAIVVALVALAAWWFTRWTQWGRWIYATGGSPEAAKRMGIPVQRVLISAYAISGLSAGIAAILVAGSIQGGSATLGQGVGGLFDAIAAVIIGGASISGGRGSVGNCIVGALMIAVIRNGLALMNLSPFAEGILVGVTILVAVELDVLRTHLERRIRTLHATEAAL
jgi:ribose transport system permease protein